MRIFLLAFTMLWSSSVFGQATSWIPFEQTQGHVRIKVKVDGIETDAIIDSGSQVNAVNTAFLDHHKLSYISHQRIRIKGVHGTDDRPIYKDIPTDIVGLELSMELVGIDLSDPSVGLLLGAPILNEFILQFDYPNSRMRFAMPQSIDLIKMGNLEMRAQSGSGQPIVKVNLNDESDLWLLLDTGNSGGIYLPRNVAESNNWLTRFPVEQGTSRGVNKQADVDLLRIPHIKFGPFVMDDVGVTVPAEGAAFDFGGRNLTLNSRIRGVRVSGILGYDVMKHFVLTIDYKNGRGHIYIPQ